MSDTSPILSLPYLMPAQAQKHVTHNEALQILDALVQLRVTRFDAETAPIEPQPGEAYALGENPTGTWAGQAGSLAIWQGEGWLYLLPQQGWRAWSLQETALRIWDGTAWVLPEARSQDLAHIGINATADAANPLSVAGPATLFSHDGDDHRLKVNKAASGDTAAMLFQSDWSGRAELGLLGDDGFAIKTSSDGSSWTEALWIDAANGKLHGRAAHFSSLKVGEGQANDVPLILHSSDANCYLSLNDAGTSGNVSVALLATGNDLKLRAGGANHITLQASGHTGINVSNPNVRLRVRETEDATTAIFENDHGSLSTTVLSVDAARTASPAFDLLRGYSGGFDDMEFRLSGDGNGSCDGAWSGGGADYAEWFEWLDGNPEEEDRRGLSVVLQGTKIRPALKLETPIGVISGNPSVVGDGDLDRWKGKYLRDVFGSYIWEDYEMLYWSETVVEKISGEDGPVTRQETLSYAADQVPEGMTIPENSQRITQRRRRLNPDFDSAQNYTPRSKRKEWDTVGLMGKLRLRKGEQTGKSWIKMRDVSADVEEWLLR